MFLLSLFVKSSTLNGFQSRKMCLPVLQKLSPYWTPTAQFKKRAKLLMPQNFPLIFYITMCFSLAWMKMSNTYLQGSECDDVNNCFPGHITEELYQPVWAAVRTSAKVNYDNSNSQEASETTDKQATAVQTPILDVPS